MPCVGPHTHADCTPARRSASPTLAVQIRLTRRIPIEPSQYRPRACIVWPSPYGLILLHDGLLAAFVEVEEGRGAESRVEERAGRAGCCRLHGRNSFEACSLSPLRLQAIHAATQRERVDSSRRPDSRSFNVSAFESGRNSPPALSARLIESTREASTLRLVREGLYRIYTIQQLMERVALGDLPVRMSRNAGS